MLLLLFVCPFCSYSDTGKIFNGTAFIECKDADEANLLVNKDLKWSEGFPLSLLTRNAYMREEKAKKAAENPEAETKKRKRDASDDGEAAKAEGEDAEKEEKHDMVRDRLIRFESVGTNSSRESLKSFIEIVGGEVAYVDYSRGETTAVIRLRDGTQKGAAEIVKELQEKQEKLDDVVPTIKSIEGEEEETYWKNAQERINNAKKLKSDRKGGRGGGRGGRGRGRGRGRGGRGGRGGNRD